MKKSIIINKFYLRKGFKMKKWMISTLSLIALLCTCSVSAATLIPSQLTRNIKLQKTTANNSSVQGVSATTGLPSKNLTYIAILTQIDNNLEAIPQWGISFADIMYELPIQGQGWTRLTALFSDRYPQEAGPVRSGRVMHADLREEWDAALVFYGMQEAPGSNMKKSLSDYGVTAKGLAIDGIGNKYQAYFQRVRYHSAPHNVSAYIENIHNDLLVKQGYEFPNRPFLFTDESYYNGQPAQQFSVIHKGNKDSSSTFAFDEVRNGYHRFTQQGAYFDYLNPTEIITYSNVIVQRTKLSFNNSSMNPILPNIVGSGAADIFVSGQYIAGAWNRDKAASRTTFYDQNGAELSLQRGKTWIVICDESTNIAIGEVDNNTLGNLYIEATEDENGRRLANNTEDVIQPSKSPDAMSETKDNLVTPTEKSTLLDSSKSNQTAEALAIVKVKNNGPLNMRKSESGKSEIILRIPNGSKVIILEKKKEWTLIKFEDKEGYVMTQYLEF